MDSNDHYSVDEKIEKLVRDEDIEELKRLLSVVKEHGVATQRPGEMAVHIELQPSPALGEQLGIQVDPTAESAQFLNLLNRLAHAYRRVEFAQDKRERPELPVLVAEGDSWFLHQALDDTLDHLRKSRFNVRSMAAAGDTVERMLADDHYIDILRDERSRVFLFCGGGNDLLGGGRIRQVVVPDAPDRSPAELINETKFADSLRSVVTRYEQMISKVANALPGTAIISHGYDHVVRIDKGPWLWPYLKDMGYSKERALAVVRILLDRFNDSLSRMDQRFDNFTHVDVRGVVGPHHGSWYDAIHPKSPGFGKVAELLGDTAQRAMDIPLPHVSVQEATFGASGRARGSESGAIRIPAHEAITRVYRERTDFERVRAAVYDLPPRSGWITFKDPLVHHHIQDVIDLLTDPDHGQSEEQVKNRGKTRPQYAAEGTADRSQAYAMSPSRNVARYEAIDVSEALFGNTEIEPIQVMLKGYQAGKSVARVQVMNPHGTHIGHGTGFLVAPGLLLTNHHVLSSADEARRSFVVFDDETQLDGSTSTPTRFRLTDDIFWSSEAHDYAFVSVESANRDGVQLSKYGFLPLVQESGKALAFEPVSIIQHPGGNPKSVAIRNSFVMGRKQDGIYYTTDTKGGSSGSPVLNREWQVVALHHRFVPHPTVPGDVIANRGVRVSKIYEDLFHEQGMGNRMVAHVLKALNHEISAPSESGSPDRETGSSEALEPSVSAVDSGAYHGLDEEEFFLAISNETSEIDSDIPLPDALSTEANFFSTEALPADRESVLQRIGTDGYRFIVAHEVSSQAWYNKKLRNPVLPGAFSGVTIGIGYDLGHVNLSEFRRHWGDLLSSNDLARLEVCVGRTKSAAAAVLPSVKSVSIPYESAITVFERSSLPKFFGHLNKHVNDIVLASLPPNCTAALISLTFNRGPSFQKSGDRYKEMREIRKALHDGALEVVPDLIRSMKRLWVGKPKVKGLLRRRDEEAELFEAGLSEVGTGGGLPSPFEDGEFDPTPDHDEESTLAVVHSATEAATPKISWGDVGWVNTFSNNPDYAHLPASAEGSRFTLNSELIETAIALGHYAPHFTDENHLIVGIRGVEIESGDREVLRRSNVTLAERKPDHRNFRCVMAVYHRATGEVSVFQASTVPNRGGVSANANRMNGHGGSTMANMLPTGCYQLCVGTHFGSQKVPTVLRLGKGTGPSTALKVTTLRTKNDGVYGSMDLWDPCKPGDNVHPAFGASSAEFSSLGCLTIPGTFSGGVHKGTWAVFRGTASFDGDEHMGTRYDIMLTTGMELGAISQASESEKSSLQRLSHGSTGASVEAMQTALGVGADGDFGPTTKKRLAEAEAKVAGGAATGLYTALTEKRLGFGLF